MNWLRQNPFVAGLLGVLVVGCGALGFLTGQVFSAFSSSQENYSASVQKLHQLQNKAPFPDAANLQKAQDLRDRFRQQLEALRSQVGALQIPLNPQISPQQFQDELRAAFNDFTRRAEAAKVKLPENFYLGFNDYSTTPPPAEAAPALARELVLIVQLMNSLLGNNPENPLIQSLDFFDRQKISTETGQPNLTETRQGQPPRKTEESKLQKMVVSVGFTTDQGKLRMALNNLLQFKSFLIIRTLSVENSQTEGPPIEPSTPAATSASPANLFTEAPTTEPQRSALNVVLGREVLRVYLLIEFVDFSLPAAAPAS